MDKRKEFILVGDKLINVADLPAIMCGIRNEPEPRPPALQLAPSLVPTTPGEVLYYPGCGTDYGPLVHLAPITPLKAVVYVDYYLDVADVKAMLRKATRILGAPEPSHFSELHPKELGVEDWAGYWPEVPLAQHFSQPTSGTGFLCELLLPSGPVKFVFLHTEGHQTYVNLLRTPLQPDIVVLQDHGFGGNWTDFGGESPMFEMAEQHRNLPMKLFVAEGTRAWPGYYPTEDYSHQAGQMHDFPRALFALRHPSMARGHHRE